MGEQEELHTDQPLRPLLGRVREQLTAAEAPDDHDAGQALNGRVDAEARSARSSPPGRRRGGLHDGHALRPPACASLGHPLPVDDVPPRLHVVGAAVLVAQVVRVLPDSTPSPGVAVLRGLSWFGVEHEAGPSWTSQAQPLPKAQPRLGHLPLELVQAAERVLDSLRQLALRLGAAVRVMVSQKSEWLAWPPPLLRMAVRTSWSIELQAPPRAAGRPTR